MSEDKSNQNELNEEFRKLGIHLMDSIRSIWDRPEREKLQKEVEEGLDTFTNTMKEEVQKFRQSPTGQQLKFEIEDLNQRIKSGEAEQLARQEVINALRKVNQELEKVIQKWDINSEQGNKQETTTSEDG